MDAKRKNELGQQLCDAAVRGHLSVVESLIAQGADVNHTDTREGVGVFPLWRDYYQYIFMCFLVRVMVGLQVNGLNVCQLQWACRSCGVFAETWG
jgi:hypothetical protein